MVVGKETVMRNGDGGWRWRIVAGMETGKVSGKVTGMVTGMETGMVSGKVEGIVTGIIWAGYGDWDGDGYSDWDNTVTVTGIIRPP